MFVGTTNVFLFDLLLLFFQVLLEHTTELVGTR